MNIERWTAALSAQSPCGEDLEYDEQFMALARAVVGKPEQQYGDTVIAAEKPDWREVERVADEVMMRTKDVRVCVLLVRALTQNQGAPGLAAGLGVMYSLLEQHWDDIHPRLRLEGEDDPYVRISAIAELAHVPGLIRDIRHAVLIKTPIGPILVKEAENVLENGLSESGVSRQQLLGLAGDAWRESQPSLLGFDGARAMLGLIETLCTEKFGERQSPDLSPLTSLLARLTAVLPRAPDQLSAGCTTRAGCRMPISRRKRTNQPCAVTYQARATFDDARFPGNHDGSGTRQSRSDQSGYRRAPELNTLYSRYHHARPSGSQSNQGELHDKSRSQQSKIYRS